MTTTRVKVAESPGHAQPTPDAAPARIGAGDLYRAHAGFVAGFLCRMGAKHVDVADLTQEVFLVAHRRGGYAEGPARPTTWLAEIAVRVLSTHRRSARRKPTIPAGETLEQRHAETPPPDLQVDSIRALEQVQRCLDGLDLEHRAVFVLFELEGEPCSGIATALGIPIGTVYSRLHNARKKFLDAWALNGGSR